MRFREFSPVDFDIIREIDHQAWAEFAPSKNTMNLRTMTNILSNWSEDPHGCFLAENKHRVLGYVFNHTWGKLGWIGTFGVRPDYRGGGIGKRLLEKSIEYLTRKGCDTIGLETRPENPYNVGMYISHNFRPTFVTLLMSLPVRGGLSNGIGTEWSELSRSDQVYMMKQFRSICHHVKPGLDYTKVGKLRVLYREGEIVSLGNFKNPFGFAIVRTVSPRLEKQFGDALVEVLAILPGYESKFLTSLRTLKGLAVKWSKSNLVVPVNTRDWRVVRSLANEGFRVRRAMLRMVYKERETNNHILNLNSWLM